MYYGYDERWTVNRCNRFEGDLTQYTYDIDNNMLTIKQPDGRIWLTNGYDKRHRVIVQTCLDGSHASYALYSTGQFGHDFDQSDAERRIYR